MNSCMICTERVYCKEVAERIEAVGGEIILAFSVDSCMK